MKIENAREEAHFKKRRKQKTKTSLGQDSDPRDKTLPVVHKTFMSEGVKNPPLKANVLLFGV